MKFEFQLEDFQFFIEIKVDSHFQLEKRALNPNYAYFQVFITSSRLEEEDSMTHFQGGVLLPREEDEMMAELETLLDQEGMLEHILDHWDLEENESSLPPWASEEN